MMGSCNILNVASAVDLVCVVLVFNRGWLVQLVECLHLYTGLCIEHIDPDSPGVGFFWLVHGTVS